MFDIDLNSTLANFNQNLNGWDVSSGETLVSLFLILVFCSFLHEDVWFWNSRHTDLVTYCSLLQKWMFYGLPDFNQNLNEWDVSAVTVFVSLC